MASHVRDSSAHSNLLTAGEGLPTGSSRVIAVRLVVLSCCSLTAIWSYLSCVTISPTNLARTSCCSHVRFSMASHSNLFSSCIASISSRIDDVSDNRLWVSSKLPSSWKCTVTIPCRINWSRQWRCPQQQCQVQASTRSTLASNFLSILWRNPADIQHVLQWCRIQVQRRMQCGHDPARWPTSNERKWENDKLRGQKKTSPNTKNTQMHKVTNDIYTVHGSHTKAKANIITLVQVISECLCPDATSSYRGNQQQSPHVAKRQNTIKCTSFNTKWQVLFTTKIVKLAHRNCFTTQLSKSLSFCTQNTATSQWPPSNQSGGGSLGIWVTLSWPTAFWTSVCDQPIKTTRLGATQQVSKFLIGPHSDVNKCPTARRGL